MNLFQPRYVAIIHQFAIDFSVAARLVIIIGMLAVVMGVPIPASATQCDKNRPVYYCPAQPTPWNDPNPNGGSSGEPIK